MKILLNKTFAFFDKHSSGRVVWFFFLAANSIYALMLTVTIPMVMRHAGSMKILDLMPLGYGPVYVEKLFATLGQAGIFAYLFRQLPLDMVYPFLFAACYALFLSFALKRVNLWASQFRYLIFLPILGGVFDYLENFGIVAMLNLYPKVQIWLVYLTSTFSVLKSVFTTLAFLSVIFMLVLFLMKWFFKKSLRSL